MGKINLKAFDHLLKEAKAEVAAAEEHTLDWSIKQNYVTLLESVNELIDRKSESKVEKPKAPELKVEKEGEDTKAKEIEKTDKKAK